MRRLKLDGGTIRACGVGWELCQQGLPTDDTGWRKALAACGTDGCRAAAAMSGGDAMLRMEAVLEQNPCVRVEQLVLSGRALFDMGLRGAQIGRAQRYLLEYVIADPDNNRTEILISKLEEFLHGS